MHSVTSLIFYNFHYNLYIKTEYTVKILPSQHLHTQPGDNVSIYFSIPIRIAGFHVQASTIDTQLLSYTHTINIYIHNIAEYITN
jgi:hypothetical protein